MTKEEREKQLQGYKWKMLYVLFIALIVWILVSTIQVWHMRLEYADTGIKIELSNWNIYNIFPESKEVVVEED